MRTKINLTVIFLLVFIFMIGCSAQKTNASGEKFPQKITETTRIEIRQGDGKKTIITSPKEINNWLQKVKKLTFIRNKNQEKIKGYLYNVSLLNGNKLIYSFSTTMVNDYNIQTNQALIDTIDQLVKSESNNNEAKTQIPLRTDGKWVQLSARLHYLQGTVISIKQDPEGKDILTIVAEKTYQSETDPAESPYKNGTEYSFVLKNNPTLDIINKKVIVYGGQMTSNDRDQFMGVELVFVESNHKMVDLNGKEAVLPPKEYPYQF